MIERKCPLCNTLLRDDEPFICRNCLSKAGNLLKKVGAVTLALGGVAVGILIGHEKYTGRK